MTMLFDVSCRRRSRWAFVLICLAAFAWAGVGPARADAPLPSGNCAFLHDGTIWIGSAGGADGDSRAVPRSKGAISFSLSPSGDGTLLFFAPRGDSQDRHKRGGPDLQAFLSRPPYSNAESLPLYVGKDDDINVSWSASGDAEIGVGDLLTRHIDGKTGKLTTEEARPAKQVGAVRRRSLSGAKDVLAYTDGDNQLLMVRAPGGGAETVLFTPKSPGPLFAAIKRAHNPTNLKPLTDETDPGLWSESRNWCVGAPALTPDKTLVLFAANLGTGMGAQGNTSFCLFAADAASGKLSVLSKAGTFFGRVPTDGDVSSDSKRLFFTTSAHSSAADNSSSGYVIDLETQTTREIIRSDPAHAGEANLIAGWCWSLDGRFLAISVLYYNPQKLGGDSEPDMDAATLYIKDAATGRIVRQIPHARAPAWGK